MHPPLSTPTSAGRTGSPSFEASRRNTHRGLALDSVKLQPLVSLVVGEGVKSASMLECLDQLFPALSGVGHVETVALSAGARGIEPSHSSMNQGGHLPRGCVVRAPMMQG